MFSLGKNSEKNIIGIDAYIQLITWRGIEITKVDFGILNTGGLRTAKMQNDIYKKGNSDKDGFKKLSYHQSGKAIDWVPYINKKYTWSNKAAFIELHRAFVVAEAELKAEGKIPMNVYFHHGIFWKWRDLDKDGVLEITDKLGWDSAHHERRGIPQII